MATIWPTKPHCDALIRRAIRLSIAERTTSFHGPNANTARKNLMKRARNARKALRQKVLVLERKGGQY